MIKALRRFVKLRSGSVDQVEVDPFELPSYRITVVQIGLLATIVANGAFALSRYIGFISDHRPNPWWCNAASFVFLLILFRWFRGQPVSRVTVTAHGTALIATIGLLTPLAYGLASSVWWLSLVGLAMILMADARAAIFWCVVSWLLIASAPEFAAHHYQFPKMGEPALEATLSRTVFPLVAFAIALAFRMAVRRQARELRRIAAELERANAAKDRFLRHIGHEFRTPLHVLMANTEQALGVERDATQRARLQAARDCAEELLAQVNQVIEFASGSDSPQVPVQQRFYPEEVISRCQLRLHAAALNKGLTIGANIESQLAIAFYGDRVGFEQIVDALTDNALHFTEHGHLSIALRRSDRFEAGLCLTISDTGVGMSERQRERAFVAFGRGDQASTRGPGGLGLGLARVGRWVSAMNGEIRCESALGVGTTMVVDLPLQPATALQAEAPPYPDKRSSALTLLVCEDDAACRDLLVAALTALGHETHQASDGLAGLQMLKERHFDALITDLEMPRLDGNGLLVAVRDRQSAGLQRPLPVVAVTASASAQASPRILAAGFDAVLPKPFLLSDLEQALECLVGYKSRDAC